MSSNTNVLDVQLGDRFAFGRNWRSFIELVDEARIEAATESLVLSLRKQDLQGLRFLDAGCGSGLFSLAAQRLGATVHSFDYDPQAVGAATELRKRFGTPNGWQIEEGSILDSAFMARLGTFDIVYSWGVLHHTGAMWSAIDSVAKAVIPGGLLYISIYNDQGPESRAWRWVKRRYNKSGRIVRSVFLAAAGLYLYRHVPVVAAVRALSRQHNAQRSDNVKSRGMSKWHDLVDWVGGYPFEVATPEEVFSSMRGRGFELRYLKTCGGGVGCNHYVFERNHASG